MKRTCFFSGSGSVSGSNFAPRTEISIVGVILDSDPDPDESGNSGCWMAAEFVGGKGLSP